MKITFQKHSWFDVGKLEQNNTVQKTSTEIVH